jgi:cytochrome c-type biogenesis protein CcmH
MGSGADLLPPSDGSAAPGPTAEDIAAAQQMSPQDQQAMINGMVERLASRLEANPDDPEGWARLINARMVLGDQAAAQAAYDKAAEVFASDPVKLALVKAGAAQAGLSVN